MKKRIAILNTHPIQYFAPLYAALNEAPDLDIDVLYLSDASLRGATDAGFSQPVAWDIDLLAGYAHRIVGARARTVVPGGFFSLATPHIWRVIRRGRYDALIVHGTSHLATLIAMAAAKSCGTKVLMRTDSHLQLSRVQDGSGHATAMRKTVFAACDGFLATGSPNAAYYRRFGVANDKIVLMPFAVDNARFIAGSSLDDKDRQAERASLGVHGDEPIVLYASKLQRRKHPDDVLRAADMLHDEGIPLHVVVAGTGEMEDELQRLARSMAVPVTFADFVNQSRMPRLLGACDVFVLPAEDEPWALVVNEAMCAGLPVVVGRDVGCVPDLVREGENGALVMPGNAGSLRDALRPLLKDGAMRARYGNASRARIERWSFRESLVGLRESLARL